MEQGERTYVGDEPIDGALGLRQHEAYRDALRRCGAEIVLLEILAQAPKAADTDCPVHANVEVEGCRLPRSSRNDIVAS